MAAILGLLSSACSTAPLEPYTKDTPPLVLVPAAQAGVVDKRGRFREIFCAILEQRGDVLPDYRSCDQALTRVGAEPEGTGEQVELGRSTRGLIAVIIPGVGWDCFADWLDIDNAVGTYTRELGYQDVLLPVDGLSSTTNNARQIRDAVVAMDVSDHKPDLVLIGYSKGAADILEAIVSYPEIRPRVAAVVSAAGAVGGSALANDATQSDLALLRHWPDAGCTEGDGGAIASLRPSARKTWLAQNPLPGDIPFYSLVTYPDPERISTVLQSSYRTLSRIDARNDGQILFYDQVIPGSTLLGFVNADHWALAVPIARTHKVLGSTVIDKNDYPREALLEAIMRFIEEDLTGPME